MPVLTKAILSISAGAEPPHLADGADTAGRRSSAYL
jgi:hypothetical protein